MCIIIIPSIKIYCTYVILGNITDFYILQMLTFFYIVSLQMYKVWLFFNVKSCSIVKTKSILTFWLGVF